MFALCGTRKLFRLGTNNLNGLDLVVKLNNDQIAWIVKHVDSKDVSTKDAATTYNVTQRRAQQLAKEYREQGEIPKLNPDRRPETPLTKEDKEAIDLVWEETRFGSKHLYKELKHRGYKVPKNKLIRYLRDTGKSIPNPNKQKTRKRDQVCLYAKPYRAGDASKDYWDVASPKTKGFPELYWVRYSILYTNNAIQPHHHNSSSVPYKRPHT